MQRGSGMRGFGRLGGGTGTARSSIKNRLGFGGATRGQRRGIAGGPSRIAAAAVRSISGGNGTLGRRLVSNGSGARAGGIKARLGTSAANTSIQIGQLSDARQKINLNRVQTGRIGDARQKIEEKRRKKAIQSGKIKNLRITTRGDLIDGGSAGGPPQSGYVSRTERESIGHQGMFRSAVEDAVSHVLRNHGGQSGNRGDRGSPTMMMSLTRTVGGGGYPSGMRIAPPSDDFMLTRTIRNPGAAGYGGQQHQISDHHSRSPLQPKIAPSIQYAPYNTHHRGGNGGRLDERMDEDDYEVDDRRLGYHHSSSSGGGGGVAAPSNYSSQSKILVSNLQPSVTADDIVELFSDIGPLVGARMTSSGQAEVTYSRKADALKAIEAYHNRLLDGSAMRVFLETSRTNAAGDSNSLTGLKSASGASMKLPKSASGIKIQPDISAIHKVLFNPGSSATRGLFKGGQ